MAKDFISFITKAGSVSLEEAFTRSSDAVAETSDQIASLLKAGQLRISTSSRDTSGDLSDLINPASSLSLDEISKKLAKNSVGEIAEMTELVPTTKFWRNVT